MMASCNIKVATVIENLTGQGLTMKVGNPHCFVRMASVKTGEGYTVRLCVDWTYQEFVFEDKDGAGKKLFVSSDDCCDYERITVKESEGAFYVETVPRKQFGEEDMAVIVDNIIQPSTVPRMQFGEEDAAVVDNIQPSVAVKKEKFRWRFWVKAH